jgi:hypothetical protein
LLKFKVQSTSFQNKNILLKESISVQTCQKHTSDLLTLGAEDIFVHISTVMKKLMSPLQNIKHKYISEVLNIFALMILEDQYMVVLHTHI